MRKKRTLLMFVLLLILTSITASGYELDKEKNGKRISGSFNTRFASKHIWRGFNQFKDKGAVQPSLNLDWFGTGFSSTIWSCWSFSDGNEDQEEIDYVTAYSNSLFNDSNWKMNYTINWIYYDYPHTASKDKDAQEIGMNFSWPKLLTIGSRPLVPSYYVGKLWPAQSNANNSACGGWVHILGLGYDVPVANLFTVGQEQLIHLSAELVYNDGMGGKTVDHDWSHCVFGISTDIPFGVLILKPELNYQISMDDSVNKSNEFWCALNVLYKF
ncbi:MAG: hypothetical protein V2A54_05195 [Bacteroidota bacterium]